MYADRQAFFCISWQISSQLGPMAGVFALHGLLQGLGCETRGASMCHAVFCHTCSVAAIPNVLCAGFPTDIVDPKMGAVLSNRVQLWCLILCYRESVHASDSAEISGVLLNPGGDSPSALVSRWSSFALPLHGVLVVSRWCPNSVLVVSWWYPDVCVLVGLAVSQRLCGVQVIGCGRLRGQVLLLLGQQGTAWQSWS